MNFFKQKYEVIKKKTLHYFNPDQNPTDIDKYAFNLLDKAQIDLFIQFMQQTNVNLNVLDFNKNSLLIKAQGIPGYKNAHTKNFTKSQLQDKAIIAISYLIKKGININYQNKKNGITALLGSCHWGYKKITNILLQNGADPNLGSNDSGFCTNPLLSAVYKNHKQIITLLIIHGAKPEIAQQYSNKSHGFKLSKKEVQYLYSCHNIYKLVYRRRFQKFKNKKSVLSQISQLMFSQVCNNV